MLAVLSGGKSFTGAEGRCPSFPPANGVLGDPWACRDDKPIPTSNNVQKEGNASFNSEALPSFSLLFFIGILWVQVHDFVPAQNVFHFITALFFLGLDQFFRSDVFALGIVDF